MHFVLLYLEIFLLGVKIISSHNAIEERFQRLESSLNIEQTCRARIERDLKDTKEDLREAKSKIKELEERFSRGNYY